MSDRSRFDFDWKSASKSDRAKATAEWTAYARLYRSTLTQLEAKAVELREDGKTLTDELARGLDEARTFLKKAERQLKRLEEASK